MNASRFRYPARRTSWSMWELGNGRDRDGNGDSTATPLSPDHASLSTMYRIGVFYTRAKAIWAYIGVTWVGYGTGWEMGWIKEKGK